MPPELREVLLIRVRATIARELGRPIMEDLPDHPALTEPGASFVTLHRNGQLRGCIGSLEAARPLCDDLTRNAVGAAFRDPRFPPLTDVEFDEVDIEVSLLTRPEFLTVRDEADALSQLRPGIDGVILIDGCHQATFLPQVWNSLREPREFLAQLKRKAGLRADAWSTNTVVARYQVSKFAESDHA